MNHRLTKWASALSLLVLLIGCKPEVPEQMPAVSLPSVTITATTIEAKAYPAAEEVVGTLRARRRVIIESKMSGHLQKVTVQAGDRIEEGDLLGELDAQELQARRDQALVQREQARRDLKRMNGLFEQHAVTQQEHDLVEARERIASASVKEAEAILEHSKITAPFSGVVTRKLVENGDLAAPGKPLLEIEDPQSLRFEADVAETLMARVKMGAPMSVRIPALDREVIGTVAEISPVADMASRTVRVKFDIPAAAGLRSGLFARVAIPLGSVKALRVPAGAVMRRGQLEYIFVVQSGKARLRLVKSGPIRGDEVELVSGLEDGEQIATGDVGVLADGQPVTVH